MRETFATIMQKRVYTLQFDRSSVMRQGSLDTLTNAKRNRGTSKIHYIIFSVAKYLH
jgi:hypothetical protein